jgi:hypothetical protein
MVRAAQSEPAHKSKPALVTPQRLELAEPGLNRARPAGPRVPVATFPEEPGRPKRVTSLDAGPCPSHPPKRPGTGRGPVRPRAGWAGWPADPNDQGWGRGVKQLRADAEGLKKSGCTICLIPNWNVSEHCRSNRQLDVYKKMQ